MLTNNEDDPGSRPCDRECSYCHLLRETEGKDFKSVTTGCKYKVRQKITCEAKDVIYVYLSRSRLYYRTEIKNQQLSKSPQQKEQVLWNYRTFFRR